MKRIGFTIGLITAALGLFFAACGSTGSSSSTSSYTPPRKSVQAIKYLNANDIASLKQLMAGASKDDLAGVLFLILQKEYTKTFNREKHSREVVEFLIDQGAAVNDRFPGFVFVVDEKDERVGQTAAIGANEKERSITYAARFDDFEAVKVLVENGANINYRGYEERTALIWAATNDNSAMVQYLVEHGANVNLRAEDGSTAASKAYDKGNIEIYDYLKEHGARDFEQRQIAQQPPAQTSQTTTNNYYNAQPSAPAQSAPAQPNNAQKVQESLKQFQQEINPLEGGTYKMSGRPEEIVIAGLTAGNLYFTDAKGARSSGVFTIKGNTLTVTILGNTYFYTITSKRSFSGNNEVWNKIGF